MEIKGCIAVVTGGASGLGEASVRTLINEGAKAAILDFDEERGTQLAAELGDSVVFYKTDITDENAVQNAVDKTVDEISLDARNSYLRLEQSAKRIKVAEKTIEHAKENFRINKEQYQAQLSTSTDVLDAQTLLSQAMTNYYDALYGYHLALAAIEKSEGLLGLRYTK